MECGKKCPQCELIKPIEDYYISNRKCKECVKKNVREKELIRTSTPEGLEKERQRHRDKYHRLGYKEKQLEWDKDKPWKQTSTYKNLKRDLKVPKGLEAHHWNYNDGYLKDVFILDIKDHKKVHINLLLDLDKRVFYLQDGTYLDTKEKHKDYIEQLGIEIKRLN